VVDEDGQAELHAPDRHRPHGIAGRTLQRGRQCFLQLDFERLGWRRRAVAQVAQERGQILVNDLAKLQFLAVVEHGDGELTGAQECPDGLVVQERFEGVEELLGRGNQRPPPVGPDSRPASWARARCMRSCACRSRSASPSARVLVCSSRLEGIAFGAVWF
jgi:hypothetical protein